MTNELPEGQDVEQSHGHHRKLKPWEYWVDLLIVVALSTGLFALLGHYELEHELLFLYSVIFALFGLKHGIWKSILPGILIIGFGALVHLKQWQHALIILPAGIIAGLIHTYAIEEAKRDAKKSVWIVVVAEMSLNVLLTAVLVMTKDPIFHEAHSLVGELVVKISGNSRAVEEVVHKGVIGLIAMFGVLEALVTHIIVHFVEAKVFKEDVGSTFGGIAIDFPWYVTAAYLLPVIYSVYSLAAPSQISGFLLTLQEFSLILVFGLFIFYVYTGCGFIKHVFNKYFKKNLTPVVILIGVILAPLVWALEIIDSLFNLRKNIEVVEEE